MSELDEDVLKLLKEKIKVCQSLTDLFSPEQASILAQTCVISLPHEGLCTCWPLTSDKSVLKNLIAKGTEAPTLLSYKENPVSINSAKEVRWFMEILNYGLSMDSNFPVIKHCVHVYNNWLKCLLPSNGENEKTDIPSVIRSNKDVYGQDIIIGLCNFFLPRHNNLRQINIFGTMGKDSYSEAQSMFRYPKKFEEISSILFLQKWEEQYPTLVHSILIRIEEIARKNDSKSILTETWNCLLQFSIAVCQALLAPVYFSSSHPNKGSINTVSNSNSVYGSSLILSHLLTDENLCDRAVQMLMTVWLNACLKSYPSDEYWNALTLSARSWRHRFSFIKHWSIVFELLTFQLLNKKNPTSPLNDLYTPYIDEMKDHSKLENTWFKMLHLLDNIVDLSKEHIVLSTPVLEKCYASGYESCRQILSKGLPLNFYQAVQVIARMLDAMLDITPCITTEMISSFINPQNSFSFLEPIRTSIYSLGQANSLKGPEDTSALDNCRHWLNPDTIIRVGNDKLEVNTLWELVGDWLYEASLTDASSLDQKNGIISSDKGNKFNISNSFQSGRAEAIAALCRIMIYGKRSNLKSEYLAKFYICLQNLCHSIEKSDYTVSLAMMNMRDILRCDIDGISLLIPDIFGCCRYILNSVDMPCPPYMKLASLRLSAIHQLCSIVCIPLHYKDIPINSLKMQNQSRSSEKFYSLKNDLSNLLMQQLSVEEDSDNIHILLSCSLAFLFDYANHDQDAIKAFNENPKLDPNPETLPGFHARLIEKICDRLINKWRDVNISTKTEHVETQPKAKNDFYGEFPKSKVAKDSERMSIHENSNNSFSIPIKRTPATVNDVHAIETLSSIAEIPIQNPNSYIQIVKALKIFIRDGIKSDPKFQTRTLHNKFISAFHCLQFWITYHSEKMLSNPEIFQQIIEITNFGFTSDHNEKAIQIQPASFRVWQVAQNTLSLVLQSSAHLNPGHFLDAVTSKISEKDLYNSLKTNADGSEETDMNKIYKEFQFYWSSSAKVLLSILEIDSAEKENPDKGIYMICRGSYGKSVHRLSSRQKPILAENNEEVGEKQEYFVKPWGSVIDSILDQENLNRKAKVQWFPENRDLKQYKIEQTLPTIDDFIKHSGFKDKLNDIRAKINGESSKTKKISIYRRDTTTKPQNTTPSTNRLSTRLGPSWLTNIGYLPFNRLSSCAHALNFNLDHEVEDQIHGLEHANCSITPFVFLNAHDWKEFRQSINELDEILPRTTHNINIYYVKKNEEDLDRVVIDFSNQKMYDPEFFAFMNSLGKQVDLSSHSGWSGRRGNFDSTMFDCSTNFMNSPQRKTLDNHQAISIDGQSDIIYWSNSIIEIAAWCPPILPNEMIENDTSATEKSLDMSLKSTFDMNSSSMNTSSIISKSEEDYINTISVVWVEQFEDIQKDLIGQLKKRLLPSSSMVIFVNCLSMKLFRATIIRRDNTASNAGPLISGMLLTQQTLANLIRQTLVTTTNRHQLASSSYHTPQKRRITILHSIIKANYQEMNRSNPVSLETSYVSNLSTSLYKL